jgi:phytoene synthase
MISHRIASTFRKGSTTYFYSSIFFPPDVRGDVFKLYAFVRTADDFVDQVPQDIDGLRAFVARYRAASGGARSGDEVVDGFVELSNRRRFDPSWTESFFRAMRDDTESANYHTLSQVERYMHGSAEVVGLFMARILGLPEESHESAKRLGTAMQYINFLRDIDEDLGLGRTYVPSEVLLSYGLESLSPAEARQRPDRFEAMMRGEVERYRRWQAEAESGYRFLPTRYRVPIKTAADMYAWTADRIAEDPLVVFETKVKPSVLRVMSGLARNALAGAAAEVLRLPPVRRLRRAGTKAIATVRSAAL